MKKPISIKVAQSDKSPRAKRFKQFNTLLNKINKLKQELETLKEQMSSGLAFFHQEVKPLHQRQQDLMVKEVEALHRAYPQKTFGKKDREKIAHLIVSRCENLFQVQDRDFPELTEIFNFYADQTREELAAEAKQLEREMAEDMLHSFGLDIELDDEDDLEEILAKAEAASERQEQEKAEKSAKRPKTERQQLKEEQERQKEKDIQKVSKNIYAELVRLLHPDREQDEAQRAVKTTAIQRVNEAYERNDLFELLSLQAEYLQKEGDQLSLLPEKEFKYYLDVLRSQEQELQQTLNMSKFMPGIEGYVAQFFCHPNPNTMQIMRQRAVREEKEAIKSYQHNLNLAKDLKALKDALRYYEIEEDDEFMSFEDFFGEIDAYTEEMEKGKKGGKKKK